jgi:REP element-mobilizing transposase RayT
MAKLEDLRKGRCSEVGRCYLVTAVARGRQPLFADWYLGCRMARLLHDEQLNGCVHTYCWVVMPDHIHWLFELRSGDLSTVVCRLKARSAIMVNQVRRRSGPVWQTGFHDRAIRKEEDIKVAARYVVANPVRAGLVARSHDYPFWDAIWLG